MKDIGEQYDKIMEQFFRVAEGLKTGLDEVRAQQSQSYEKLCSSLNGLTSLREQIISTQNSLLDAHVLVENIVDSMNSALMILDSDLKVLLANKTFYELFQVNTDETIGNKIYALGNNQWDIPELRVLLEDIIPKQAVINDYIVTHVFEAIGEKTMRLNARQILQKTEKAPRILLVIEDVTERTKAEALIKDLTHSLEKKVKERTSQLLVTNEELESVIYSMSHDLYSPLRGINGYTEMLGEVIKQCKCETEATNYIELIRSISNRMEQMVSAIRYLLDLFRKEYKREKVDLSGLVGNIAQDYRQKALHRRGEFIIKPGVTAFTDTETIKIALQALIDNAWKNTSDKDYYKIEFGVQHSDSRTAYYIKDNGKGFEQKYADKIFRPFTKLEAYPTGEQGYGIGLTGVRVIIRKQLGDIWAESEVGKGATFYFTLE